MRVVREQSDGEVTGVSATMAGQDPNKSLLVTYWNAPLQPRKRVEFAAAPPPPKVVASAREAGLPEYLQAKLYRNPLPIRCTIPVL